MPKYYYVAVNEKNRKYKNEMVAESAEEVRKNLRARSLTPLSVVEASKKDEENSDFIDTDDNHFIMRRGRKSWKTGH